MAEIKPGTLPTKPVKEKRAEALERLLHFACSLLPEPADGDVNAADTRDLLAEVHFWLYEEPLGAEVVPSSPELRLGGKALTEAKAAFAKSWNGAKPPEKEAPKK